MQRNAIVYFFLHQVSVTGTEQLKKVLCVLESQMLEVEKLVLSEI